MSLPGDPESRREIGEHLKSRPECGSLISLIDMLLGEDGCPWDKSRTLEGCPEYIESELNEVIDAIKSATER